MTTRIKLLPDHISNQIAAGEVIQRPSSVVKELLENSVDANSKNIQLIIRDGGKTLIQVIDDGSGINRDDLSLANSYGQRAAAEGKTLDEAIRQYTEDAKVQGLPTVQYYLMEIENGYNQAMQNTSR